MLGDIRIASGDRQSGRRGGGGQQDIYIRSLRVSQNSLWSASLILSVWLDAAGRLIRWKACTHAQDWFLLYLYLLLSQFSDLFSDFLGEFDIVVAQPCVGRLIRIVSGNHSIGRFREWRMSSSLRPHGSWLDADAQHRGQSLWSLNFKEADCIHFAKRSCQGVDLNLPVVRWTRAVQWRGEKKREPGRAGPSLLRTRLSSFVANMYTAAADESGDEIRSFAAHSATWTWLYHGPEYRPEMTHHHSGWTLVLFE